MAINKVKCSKSSYSNTDSTYHGPHQKDLDRSHAHTTEEKKKNGEKFILHNPIYLIQYILACIKYQSTISQQSVTQLLAGWPIKYYDLLANQVLSDC